MYRLPGARWAAAASTVAAAVALSVCAGGVGPAEAAAATVAPGTLLISGNAYAALATAGPAVTAVPSAP